MLMRAARKGAEETQTTQRIDTGEFQPADEALSRCVHRVVWCIAA